MPYYRAYSWETLSPIFMLTNYVLTAFNAPRLTTRVNTLLGHQN